MVYDVKKLLNLDESTKSEAEIAGIIGKFEGIRRDVLNNNVMRAQFIRLSLMNDEEIGEFIENAAIKGLILTEYDVRMYMHIVDAVLDTL